VSRLSVRLLLVTLAACVLAGTGSAATSRVLGFSTVAHDSKPVGSDAPTWPPFQKLGTINAYIVTRAGDMTNWYYYFPAADQRRFDALNWNTHFTFLAALKQRSSGFDLTIKRVVLQRISRSARQLCVVASLEKPRPGSPIVVRPYFSAHAVAMSSGRVRVGEFQYVFPTRWVIRGTNGELLAASRAGGAYGNERPSGKPRLCTLRARASEEQLGG
jgi:hypothetical protein